MKILIIEDNDVKLNRTKNYLYSATDKELEITEVNTVNKAINLLSKNLYDRILIDMQMPISSFNGIDLEAGIKILDFLKDSININTKRAVNTSSEDSREVLDRNNFRNEIIIINNTSRNNIHDFEKFIN